MNRSAIKVATEWMFARRWLWTPGTPKQQSTQQRRAIMNRKARIILGLAFMTGLAGCASPTPVLDEHFGEAVRATRLAQTLNPDAGKNAAPVTGLDGVAAQESINRYDASFRRPPAVTNVINIGGVVGGGAGAPQPQQ